MNTSAKHMAAAAVADRPRLIFLVGLPRSGTTWLQKLLAAHPAIGTAQESHLFNHFFGHLIDSWQHLLDFDDGRGGIGLPAYQTEEDFYAMLNDMGHRVLAEADDYRNNPVFLEKTPDHVRHMEHILRVFPEAEIILMTRRTSDIIESMLSASQGWGQQWAPGSIVRALRLCRYFARRAEADLGRVDQGRIHHVRYEDLRADPDRVLHELLDSLQLEHPVETIEAMRSTPLTLHRYGEFARRNGRVVEEPDGFARQKKGKLSWLQRALVKLTLGESAIRMPEEAGRIEGTS